MKEIKFRAWDKRTESMYQWKEFETFDIKGNDIETYSYFGGGETKRDIIDIDNAIIMCYTGLKDENGKEIYHKDKVSALGYSNWIVEWHDNGWKLKQEDMNNYQEIPMRNMNNDYDADVIIIGSLYE